MLRRLALLLLLIFVLALTGACATRAHLQFIPEGGTYTAESLPVALETSDAGPTAKIATGDASAVRQQVLADLRTNGDEAGVLADVLTAEFPPGVAAVPYTVEKGAYEGEPAWIVFEAWGEPGGTLSYRRIWVFAAADKAVMAAHSVR